MQQLEKQNVLEGEYLSKDKMSRDEYIDYLRKTLILLERERAERLHAAVETAELRAQQLFKDTLLVVLFTITLLAASTGVLGRFIVEVFQWFAK